MSLFPAYSDTIEEQSSGSNSKGTVWLDNQSFQANNEQLKEAQTNVVTETHSISSSSCSSSSSSDVEVIEASTSKSSKRRKKKKHKKGHKNIKVSLEVPKKVLEFTGDEEYYVDKKPAISYKTVRTLHRPACPRYYKEFKRTLNYDSANYIPWNVSSGVTKRYFKQMKQLKREDVETPFLPLDENEYTLRLGQLNRKVLEAPAELKHWLDLIELHILNPYKWSRVMLAEKKIEIVKRAMVYHPRNDTLYRIFINTISDTFPSFEVTKLLDGLLSKDPYSYTLWTAQIMTTQGSMARCIVPDVLRIYERCMQKMHHAQKNSQKSVENFDSDGIMLRLFNNCALLLRQTGLYEQFFALVKLALELNVSINEFTSFKPNDDDQRTLIEYEELILQSGLPMNEIWLRVEKLRQCFNFLPCPPNIQCSDPQRIVFNEDVCHYIYPLESKDNTFQLMLLILRLLKVPFVQCDSLAAKFSARVDAIGDSDAVEEALTLGLRFTYATNHSKQQDQFFGSLYELAREMAVTPTYLSSSIGHEIYTKCISELLLNTSTAYAGIDERKRIIFLVLLFRFERFRLVLEKAGKKITPQFVKSGRNRFKALLKQTANRNCLILYTELAMYEFEALEYDASLEGVQNTFESIIANINEAFAYDLANTYVCYAEILVGRGMPEEALQVLAAYVLKVDIKQKSSISTARKLAALQQITEKLDTNIGIERSVEIMVLDQYLLPDQTVTLLKVRTLLQYLIGQKLETLNYLEKLLKIFCNATDRHRFLRERVYEIYITIALLPSSNCMVSNAALSAKVFNAIKDYPRNLYFLQTCGMLMLPWYRIRAAMLGDEPNILSLTFLIATARFRFLNANSTAATSVLTTLMPAIAVTEYDQKHNESIVRNRILHLFESLTKVQSTDGNNAYQALRRNALFWRFYLRCLSDQSTAFETSNKCLLTALDDCPWSKALYMDGATYVPQELPHLQDLMIEKHLRIYALPEELEILRER